MKIYQWFEYLPVKIRDKAQAYFFEPRQLDDFDYESSSLSSALWGGFTWIDTVEGHMYWEKIADKYKNFKP